MIASSFSHGQASKMEGEKKGAEKPKHEVRIIMENFFGSQNEVIKNGQLWNSPNFSNTGTYEFYDNKFNYGLGYNLNLKKFGIRARVFYNSYHETYFDASKLENNSMSDLLRTSVGINYQKKFQKIVLFIGIDVSYFKINLEQVQRSSDLTTRPDISQFTKYNGIGIEPLVGFKYFLSQHFSIGSEIRFIRDTYKGNTLITYENSYGFNSPEYEINFDGNTTKIGPKGSVSLNVHF